MPQSRVLELHHERVLWPEHKDEAKVRALKRSTPDDVWTSTYQSRPAAPGGAAFLKPWWHGERNRYAVSAPATVVGRWIAADTALKEEEQHDYTAILVSELLGDYRLRVRWAERGRMGLPDLLTALTRTITQWSGDGLLRGVVIEDKASGTSALQTLRASADPAVAPLLVPFTPHGDKLVRAKQASVYCREDCVLFPLPDDSVPWLLDFEQELYRFPGDRHDDQVDAFSMTLLYLENLLSSGMHARAGNARIVGAGTPAAPPPTDRVTAALGRGR